MTALHAGSRQSYPRLEASGIPAHISTCISREPQRNIIIIHTSAPRGYGSPMIVMRCYEPCPEVCDCVALRRLDGFGRCTSSTGSTAPWRLPSSETRLAALAVARCTYRGVPSPRPARLRSAPAGRGRLRDEPRARPRRPLLLQREACGAARRLTRAAPAARQAERARGLRPPLRACGRIPLPRAYVCEAPCRASQRILYTPRDL